MSYSEQLLARPVTAEVLGLHVWPADADLPLPCDAIELDWGGVVGDRHHGVTMASDVRQAEVFARGTQIANLRQASIVDEGELARIAAAMGIGALAPGLIADNICTRGIPDLTTLPHMTRMVFDGGAVLMLGGENTPCTIAGAMVGRVHGTTPQAFPKAAMHLRGVTGWVERPGTVRVGEGIRLVRP